MHYLNLATIKMSKLKSIPQNIEKVSLERTRTNNEPMYYSYGKKFIRKLIRVYPRGKLRRKWTKSYLMQNLVYNNLLIK